MKNKGFTLVELIACFIVLGLILLISIPKVNNLISNKEEKEQESFLSEIVLATESYVSKNKDTYPELKTIGQGVCINFNDIITSGLISQNIVNPQTKKNISLSSIIVTLNDEYKYDYNLQNDILCS